MTQVADRYTRYLLQGTSMPINIPALGARFGATDPEDAADRIHTFVPPHLIESQRVRLSSVLLTAVELIALSGFAELKCNRRCTRLCERLFAGVMFHVIGRL